MGASRAPDPGSNPGGRISFKEKSPESYSNLSFLVLKDKNREKRFKTGHDITGIITMNLRLYISPL